MKLIKAISEELDSYLNTSVEISPGVQYSEYKLKKRLALFQSKTYPTGKVDKQKKYKYWFDITTSRVNARVKNIDFDTRDVRAECVQEGYEVCDAIVNLKLPVWMKENGQAKELNDAVEEFADLGNVLFKKGKDGYKRCDYKNTFIVNTAAENVDQTPIIERTVMTQSELRAKAGTWDKVDVVIKECKNKYFGVAVNTYEETKTIPYYEIFERNGEISVAELKEAKGKESTEKDEEKYVLARVVCAGVQGGEGYVLFAEEYPSGKKLSDYFAEGHSGPYQGRWWREGVREQLLDCQTRANEIGNQLARGLEFASKKLIASKDNVSTQNILTGLRNGDILRGEFQDISMRMDGFDQLLADWNRNLANADDITNATEFVRGETPPSGTPDRLVARLDANAGKLFVFLREKLAEPFNVIFERWIIPAIVKDLKADEYAKLTGRGENYQRFIGYIVKGWYIRNLMKLPPHTPDMAQAIMEQQKMALMQRPELIVKFTRELWDGYKPLAKVDIVGEGTTLDTDLQATAQYIPMLTDPIRRDAVVEAMMKKRLRWLDIDSLPKSPPTPPPQPVQQQQRQPAAKPA